MSPAAADVVREAYATFNASGHWPPEAFHEHVVVLNLDTALETKPYFGREDIPRWERDVLEVLEHGQLQLLEVREVSADRVATKHLLRGRMRLSGLPVEVPFAAAFWLRDGLISRVEGVRNVDAALEALSTAENDRPTPEPEEAAPAGERSNADLVRWMYDRFNAGDREEAFAGFHDEVVILNLEGALERGPYHGHDGVRQWLRDVWGVLDDARFELGAIVEVAPDRLAVENMIRGRMRLSGLEFTAGYASAYWFRDGKIVRGEGHRSLVDAVAALSGGGA